jgi:hypothetical protein
MLRRLVCVFVPLLLCFTSLFAQEKFAIIEDLKSQWMTYDEGDYRPLRDASFTGLSTVYFRLDAANFLGNSLRLESDKPYFLFVNGKVCGEFRGERVLDIDSLLRQQSGSSCLIGIHQSRINERDLETEVIALQGQAENPEARTVARPYSHFRDFVVIAGLVLILSFVVAMRLNPKLASDYFSVQKLFSSRESDESQASARLTSGSNVQFSVLCSLLIGLYLLIVLYNLPPQYALPIRFRSAGFWTAWLQWIKLSAVIYLVFLLKISIIYSLTRLFGLRGMARFHFFNWIRLLLVVFGAGTVVLFIYFISRGDDPEFYVTFLSFVVVALIGWVVLAFFKLGTRSGHSMFHLFSYLCATEIIPLLITVKVLFQ